MGLGLDCGVPVCPLQMYVLWSVCCPLMCGLRLVPHVVQFHGGEASLSPVAGMAALPNHLLAKLKARGVAGAVLC